MHARNSSRVITFALSFGLVFAVIFLAASCARTEGVASAKASDIANSPAPRRRREFPFDCIFDSVALKTVNNSNCGNREFLDGGRTFQECCHRAVSSCP